MDDGTSGAFETAGPADAIETEQRRTLRRNRLLATGLLVAAVAVFAALSVWGRGFWPLLARAGAEAAVVGGLADWFAVTAIFRRPLGLPVPHTAIVPRSKDRIGEGLGAFVAGNFLTPPLVLAKLRALDPARRLAAWLGAPANAEAAAARATQLLPHLVRALDDPEIRDFAVRALGEQLREADWSAALGRALALLTAGAPFDAIFDRMLDAVQRALLDHGETIGAMVEERTAWWIPRAVDRRIALAIIKGVADFIEELRQADNPRRTALRSRLAALAEDLAASPAHHQRLEELKAQLLDRPEMRVWLAALWDGLRGIVLADLAAPASRTREAARTGLLSLGRTLAADAAIRARLNAALEEAAVTLVTPWRHAIGHFIAEVVRGWETRTVVERLELALGPDLQYIRLTGTLVGACVGCLLFLLARLAVQL